LPAEGEDDDDSDAALGGMPTRAMVETRRLHVSPHATILLVQWWEVCGGTDADADVIAGADADADTCGRTAFSTEKCACRLWA
jgi:hypothetical protein